MCRHVSIWGFQNRACLSVCPSVCPSVRTPRKEISDHPGFVNISSTLVIDTSIERSSQVLQHGNPKIWIFFQKSSKLNFVCTPRKEITQASSILVFISNWYINGKVFTSTTVWKPNFVLKFEIEFWLVPKSWILLRQWKGLHEYYNMEL